MKSFRTICLCCACFRALAGVGSLHAGTIRHDRDDGLYTALAWQAEYACVGAVGRKTASGSKGVASGVLIAGQWVLTAAHVVQDSALTEVSVTFGATAYQADDWIVHSDWNGDAGHGYDLALIHLSDPVAGIEAARLTGDLVGVGEIATVVGFGETGTGLTGSVLPRGTKRAGQNLIDSTADSIGLPESIFLADFDNPTPPGSGALDLEYMLAPGDSGGGWFLERNGQTVLVGISSFIFARDGNADSDYGDSMAATRVADYLSWIEDHGVPVPEPTSLSLLVGLWVPVAVARRRRRRGC